jgi:hypothetical protein
MSGLGTSALAFSSELGAGLVVPGDGALGPTSVGRAGGGVPLGSWDTEEGSPSVEGARLCVIDPSLKNPQMNKPAPMMARNQVPEPVDRSRRRRSRRTGAESPPGRAGFDSLEGAARDGSSDAVCFAAGTSSDRRSGVASGRGLVSRAGFSPTPCFALPSDPLPSGGLFSLDGFVRPVAVDSSALVNSLSKSGLESAAGLTPRGAVLSSAPAGVPWIGIAAPRTTGRESPLLAVAATN